MALSSVISYIYYCSKSQSVSYQVFRLFQKQSNPTISGIFYESHFSFREFFLGYFVNFKFFNTTTSDNVIAPRVFF